MSKVAEWGVQSIDGAKAASVFAVGALSGIETIGADNAAAVEYFNLQGVKVANPGSGPLYPSSGFEGRESLRALTLSAACL